MNWGRGLFRLWAVVALVWIAGTTWLQWQKIQCELAPSKHECNVFDQFDSPQANLPNKPDPASQTSIDLSKFSDAQVVALHEAGGDFTKLTDKMRKSILTSLSAGGGWQADRVVSAAPPHYDTLMDDVAPILGPPLLLLLVGGQLYWAIRGFRRTKS
jgi:hypothetical protein